MSVVAPADAKKLIEALLSDLRQLSTEAKKKHNHVKEAAEAGVVRIRNISSASNDSSLLSNLRAASNELLHPLVLACATKQAKLVQTALQGIQRLVQHRILEPACSNVVVSELWNLMEAECEELRVLQTVPPLVSAHLLVTGNNLAKCVVMCFRMHFAKDPVVINAASAAVRQIVSGIFERVIQEDGVFSGGLTVAPQSGRPSPRSAPPTLRPCAADAYLLFRDLCLLLNAEPAVWLVGMREITRTLGLELIETLLKNFPGVFSKHPELSGMIKTEVCQLVIKLLSPNLKSSSQIVSTRGVLNSDRPYFPIAMRLVRIIVVLIVYYHQLLPTECEIFVSHLLKFVDADKRGWQRALALEALHRICHHANVIKWMAENFDGKPNSSKLIGNFSNCILSIIKASFVRSHITDNENEDVDSDLQSGTPGFLLHGVWKPYIEDLTVKKTLFMDSLEKHEAGTAPDGYMVSRCCVCISDLTQAVYKAVDQLLVPGSEGKASTPTEEAKEVSTALFQSTFGGLVSGLSLLLSSSTEETVADQLLCSLSTLVSLGFNISAVEATSCVLYSMAAAALPPGYLNKYAALPVPTYGETDLAYCLDFSVPCHQVVATSQPCPSVGVKSELWSHQVMFTSRNLQAARILLSVLETHYHSINSLWRFALTIEQHVTWILAMRPTATGQFTRERGDTEAAGTSSTVTTAAMAEIPVLASSIDTMSASSASLSSESFQLLVTALIGLSDEQVAVAASGKECSLFPCAYLLRVASSNLFRLSSYWLQTTNHFIKICLHPTASLRDWAAVGLTHLIRIAMKAKSEQSEEEQQRLCLSSLDALCKCPTSEVRRRQLECAGALLETDGTQLCPSSWPTVISILATVVEEEMSCDEALVRQGYLVVRLISADFLQHLPFECLPSFIETITHYANQKADQNISLAALALLWTISDFVFRQSDVVHPAEAEKAWLVLFTCLSELCIDSRHSVRKSACHTFLQTVAAHGHALRPATWAHMIWEILMPLLDKVRSQTKNASTEKSTQSLIMHHSRDTEQKQWTETCIHTLAAACKMFNAQRKVLLRLDDFGSAWEALLSYVEWASCYENAELSLSALKCFQEVLLGKVSAQTLDINTRDRSSSTPDVVGDGIVPQLPQPQWTESWNTWQRISRGLARIGASAVSMQGGIVKGAYIPGPSHLTTLLHIFPPLFERVAKTVAIEELTIDQLPAVLESIVSIPIPLEQVPFVMPSSSNQLTPTQDAVLDAVKTVFKECTTTPHLRPVIGDQIRILLRFSSLSTRSATTMKLVPPGKNYENWALQCIIPFAEISLRTAMEFYASTATMPEVVNSKVAVDVVTFLGEPLYLKYKCLSPTTWKLAASSLMSVLRITLPVARLQGNGYEMFWDATCDTIEKYLFTPNISSRLAADERKRDELLECQAIELVRTDILPYANSVPPAAVKRFIALLNKGSICQLDPTDVLDSHVQRADLSKACFEALLSTSSDGNGRLGHVAISSLLDRCSQVMINFVRDWTASGDLRLPRTRITELTSALQAVDSLIARLAREPTLTDLFSQLVSLYPDVVDVVQCSREDPLIEAQIITTLKSFQTLMLLKSVPAFSS